MSLLKKTPKKLNRVKYKPPVIDITPKENYLFKIIFQNGEMYRVKQAKNHGRPIHFIEKTMAEGSFQKEEQVYYPPSEIKKIKWEEVK